MSSSRKKRFTSIRAAAGSIALPRLRADLLCPGSLQKDDQGGHAIALSGDPFRAATKGCFYSKKNGGPQDLSMRHISAIAPAFLNTQYFSNQS